ncbi:MAG: TraR/DksA C4-type zinc finger protein [Chloroflexi bacterium]|nr:TraR/DksA C4-type zinc finger protein [Chloroflexota bacterium]
MPELKNLLEQSTQFHHDHVCPRQVLGVRMGMYAGELLDLALPQADKRLFAFVETDGCLIDGITVATGCAVGHRTMRVMDYGKSAATFVDTLTECALRITPTRESRTRARDYAPNASDKWHAQLNAYQVMPNTELLLAQEVKLNISLAAIISRHGLRVVCEECGEDIINEREVHREGRLLCRACALGAYYSPSELLVGQNHSTHLDTIDFSAVETWRIAALPMVD